MSNENNNRPSSYGKSRLGFLPDKLMTDDDAQGAVITEAPHWFNLALACEPEHHTVDVDGCSIHYMTWGKRGAKGLLLVHGNGAHAYWWAYIAPLLADHYYVVALDHSGMGDSGHRDTYTLDQIMLEQVTVAEHAGLFDDDAKPVLIGHSYGGILASTTCSVYGERFHGLMMLDSNIAVPNPEQADHEIKRPERVGPHRVYEDAQVAIDRFRLLPPQPTENHFILEYIARYSLRAVEGGWSWKFDPNRHIPMTREAYFTMLASVKCRLIMIRGEQSILMNEAEGQKMQRLAGLAEPVIAVPGGRHHLLIDQPLALIATLRSILIFWNHYA